jgi:hypothetical protein
LKLILDRGESGRELRRSLWFTHLLVNRAASELEGVLLLCRGEAYHTGKGRPVAVEQVREEALALARRRQTLNGSERIGSDEELLAGLRQWYEAIVPSALVEKGVRSRPGNAQAAGAFAGPMMSRQSAGLQGVFRKVLDPPPGWVKKMAEAADGWEAQSLEWLATPQAAELQRTVGKPPAWLRRLRGGEPWQAAFVEDQQKKRREVAGVPSLVRRLKALGLLPLLAPPIASQFADQRAGLTLWDRSALRLAVAHLLSWEAGNRRAARRRQQILDRLATLRDETTPLEGLLGTLREYEARRHEELQRAGLADDEHPFRIGPQAIRAWDRVHELWCGPRGATQDQRLEVLAEVNGRRRGPLGDLELFRWLAQEGREQLRRDAAPLAMLARQNALERLLSRAPGSALYTVPDASLHPQWAEYEAPGGRNLRNYFLTLDGKTAAVSLALLRSTEAGVVEEEQDFRLAPSGQFARAEWIGDKKPRGVRFRSARQTFTAEPGGARLLFQRRHLEGRHPKALEDGDLGPAWLRLTLNVAPQAPEGWIDAQGRVAVPPEVRHFSTARVNRSQYEDSLAPGLRVLSVDLEPSPFAACSVFELVAGQPASGLAFPADAAKDLWARHERSFLLLLPGDHPNRHAQQARRRAFEELGALFGDLGRLRSLLGLAVQESGQERHAMIEGLLAGLSGPTRSVLDATDLSGLIDLLSSEPALWEGHVRGLHRALDARLAARVTAWRGRTRPRAAGKVDREDRRGYDAGKSAWAIEYLQAARHFLQRWSARRQGRLGQGGARRGRFAAGLLNHLNALVKDRVKTGSDSIVQAARGLLFTPAKGWTQGYGPCRLILFEDLDRYWFRTDRPPLENSRLMRTAHRQIVAETQMQAGLFGIAVRTVAAGFLSRFHARTFSPGVRARRLSAQDWGAASVVNELHALAERLDIDADRLRPGVLLPWEEGEGLLTAGEKPVLTHAAINAAQNLQRRFWTRSGDAYRIQAVEVRQGAKSVWYPDRDGARLRGALATLVGGDGYARLVAADDQEGYVLEKVTRSQWSRATGKPSHAGDGEGRDTASEAIAEEFEEGEGYERGGWRAFFRDPSGLVLRSDRWYEAKVFWSRVERRIADTVGVGRSDGLTTSPPPA